MLKYINIIIIIKRYCKKSIIFNYLFMYYEIFYEILKLSKFPLFLKVCLLKKNKINLIFKFYLNKNNVKIHQNYHYC